jgi:hypothetical protein
MATAIASKLTKAVLHLTTADDPNPSDRETILSEARRWMHAASIIERRVDNDRELACADLRTKLG